MRMTLRGYTTALLEGVAREELGRTVADELIAVERLVSRTNELAVVLTDFTVPRSARRGVLEDLLGSRINPLALRASLEAVEVERPDELLTSFHELYELALHFHEIGVEELLAEEPIATRNQWRGFASGYSAAVLEDLDDVSQLEEVEDEVFRFARIVESYPGLGGALSDPTRSRRERAELITNLLAGKVTDATLRIVQVPLLGHVRDFVSALDWLGEQVARARGWRVARVRTGQALDSDEREGLAREMQRITGQPVELQVQEEPDLLGGVVVEIGDLLVDSTARHRLDTLRDHLLWRDGAMTGATN